MTPLPGADDLGRELVAFALQGSHAQAEVNRVLEEHRRETMAVTKDNYRESLESSSQRILDADQRDRLSRVLADLMRATQSILECVPTCADQQAACRNLHTAAGEVRRAIETRGLI